MKDLYNKSALDQISSQSKMDKMVNIVPPGLWASIFGALLIIVGIIIWAFKGSIPSSTKGTGFYMNENGLTGQYANTSGMLLELRTKQGEYVEKGDVLATITADNQFMLEQIDQRIAYVQNITFESDFDTVTSDTEELAEIKRKAGSMTSEVETTKTELEVKKERLTELSGDVDEKRGDMVRYKETYYSTLALSNPDSEFRYNESEQDYENYRSAYESAKSKYMSSEENYYQQKKQFDSKYRHFVYEEATEEEQRVYDQDLANLQALADAAEDYSLLMEDAESDFDDANENLDNAREDYLEKLNEASGLSVENSIAYTEYTELLNAYNTLLSEYKALNNEISELEIKLIVDQFNELNEYEAYSQQFDNQKDVVLSRLKNERENILNEISKDSVIASTSGRIYRIDVEEGSGVSKGDKLMSIYTGDLNENCIVCYVNLKDDAKVKVGQDVHMSVAGMNINEYGYMYGTVEKVSNYVESFQTMMERVNNEQIVNQITEQGSVIEVICRITADPDSNTGYKWSNKKGDEHGLTVGDMIECQFITDQKKPIEVFIPYIIDKLDFKDVKSESEAE